MSAILSVLKIEAEYTGHAFSKASRVHIPLLKLISCLVLETFRFLGPCLIPMENFEKLSNWWYYRSKYTDQLNICCIYYKHLKLRTCGPDLKNSWRNYRFINCDVEQSPIDWLIWKKHFLFRLAFEAIRPSLLLWFHIRGSLSAW